jgi:hypothetical protein
MPFNNIFINKNVNILHSLLLFYLLIASNLCVNIFSKQIRQFINENRYAQHFLGWTILLVIIILTDNTNNISISILYSLIAYYWILCTTKLDLQWNMIILILLVMGFFYERNCFLKEQSLSKDNILSNDEKTDILKKQFKNKIKIIIVILIVTVIGTILYLDKKIVQYGGSFDIDKFIFQQENLKYKI